MSTTILHAVIHRRKSQDNYLPGAEDPAHKDFMKQAQASIDALGDFINQGYTILDSFDDQHGNLFVRQYLLHKADNSAQSVTQLHSVALQTIEVRSTYSKSYQENFDFMKCGFGIDQYVNIFDHPDPARNTWELCVKRGWSWQSLQAVLLKGLPVPAVLDYDGSWYTLIDIMPAKDHERMMQAIDYIYEDKNEQENGKND